MYGIALSAASCIRAGTRVDIAWIVDRHDGNPFDPSETIAITPGGGRLGSLLNGALDGQLIELAGTQGDQGRLVRLDISPVDAAVSGTEPGSGIGCMLVPGTALPEELWEMLLSREPVCLIAELDGPADTGVEAAWLEEAQRRHREIVEGKVRPVPGEHVFANLRARLKR